MKKIGNKGFVGGRILKTGIAVLLTSIICYSLKWPEMFAVITAIVTIEPTAKDSIKKAFVRFPASAIGAAFSVLFTYIFGDQPFSYTLVALGTIFTCHKLRLHDGILVATLTGVAMISTVHDQYLMSFLVRLGTTSIGLIVSSLVNLLIIRPDYSKELISKTKQLLLETESLIEKRGMEIVCQHPLTKEVKIKFQSLVKNMEELKTLCDNQLKEFQFHHYSREEVKVFHYENKKVTIFQQLIYHLGILNSLPVSNSQLNDEQKQLLISAIQLMKRIVTEDHFEQSDSIDQIIWQLEQHLYWHKESEINCEQDPPFQHFLPSETIILFTFISIIALLEELKSIQLLELGHKSRISIGTGWGPPFNNLRSNQKL